MKPPILRTIDLRYYLGYRIPLDQSQEGEEKPYIEASSISVPLTTALPDHSLEEAALPDSSLLPSYLEQDDGLALRPSRRSTA
jgi:hypothetical protein